MLRSTCDLLPFIMIGTWPSMDGVCCLKGQRGKIISLFGDAPVLNDHVALVTVSHALNPYLGVGFLGHLLK